MSGAQVARLADWAANDQLWRQWAVWLAQRTVVRWRPGEWDEGDLLFTGDYDNPDTATWKCRTAACRNPALSRSFCKTCARRHRASGQSAEVFAATHNPSDHGAVQRYGRCEVQRDGTRCERMRASRGLCANHAAQWLRHRDRFPGGSQAWSQTVAIPYGTKGSCVIRACRSQIRSRDGLCDMHARHWTAYDGARDPRSFVRWTSRQPPHLAVNQFSLAPLEPLVRAEVLFALQQREKRGGRIDPAAVRRLIRQLGHVPGLLNADHPLVGHAALPGTSTDHANAREIMAVLRTEFDRFRGIEPTDKLVWDLRAVKLPSRDRREGPRVNAGQADFTQVSQPWLREILMEWARATKPYSRDLLNTLMACGEASAVLRRRTEAEGEKPALLTFADMDAIVEHFRALPAPGGGLYTATVRRDRLTSFFNILDYGRKIGLTGDLAGAFARSAAHTIANEHPRSGDETGKAVPEPIIRQLDDAIGLLATATGNKLYAAMPRPQRAAMFRTLYILLRDTGRRPIEIASLRLDCLERDGENYVLVWDNHKRKRYGRRLPVGRDTAAAIQVWREQRPTLAAVQRSEGYLFPAPGEAGIWPHLRTADLSVLIRRWADAIPVIHSTDPGPDGTPLPFDRSLIYPYSFRHSYAQRHADAGTPVEVLRDLMDHQNLEVTQGYYRVSHQRKRAAVDRVRFHILDRHGTPVAAPSVAGYERQQVAVPFGGCKEPANVKAGGHACPIRFQCAGCGWYRPDPSYLPAVEEHIHTLKAQRELAAASDTDSWVIANMSSEIDAFGNVAARMREHLDAMPADEREQIEQASAMLRRTRAGTPRTLLPLTVVHRDPPADAQ